MNKEVGKKKTKKKTVHYWLAKKKGKENNCWSKKKVNCFLHVSRWMKATTSIISEQDHLLFVRRNSSEVTKMKVIGGKRWKEVEREGQDEVEGA